MSQALHLPMFCTIPYSVQADDSISDATKIYFGQLCGLAHTFGHCFATDEQLAQMKNTSVKNIERWNMHLERAGHIRRDTKNVPIQNKDGKWCWIKKRKIFIIMDNTTKHDVYPGSPKNEDSVDIPKNEDSVDIPKNEGYNNKALNVKEEQQPNEQKAPSAVVVFSSLQKLEVDDKFRIKIIKQHPDILESEWDIAVERCLSWEGRPSDEVGIITVLRKWYEWKDKPKEEDIAEKNRKHLESFKHLHGTKIGATKIEVGYRYIEFITGLNSNEFFIEDKDFFNDVNEFINYLKEKVKENESCCAKTA